MDEYMRHFDALWNEVSELAGLDMLIQLGLIAAFVILAWLVGRVMRARLTARLGERMEGEGWQAKALFRLVNLAIPLSMFVFMLLLSVGLTTYEVEAAMVDVASSLAGAWIVARLAAMFIRERFWYRLVATAVWTVAALDILGVREHLVEFMDSLAITVNRSTISLWSLAKAFIILLILVRLGLWLARLFDGYMSQAKTLSPSARVLISKSGKVIILGIAGLLALQSVGINLSTLAVLGGAVGVGVGFGLQKVVSNLVSGVILLLDRSIKPGDVIQVGDVLGRIANLQARYVSVITRDGSEFLIPNEDLITGQVVNLSFTSPDVRLRVPIGVAYDTDLRQAMELMNQAASGVNRVLNHPAPVTQIKGFGDSSVDLELRFWIRDPANGVANVKTAVILRIWDAFQEHQVSIPFPQREVRLLGDAES